MQSKLIAAVVAAGTLGLAGTAAADGWNIRDLGQTIDRPECMAKADNVLRWYEQTYYASSYSQSTWTSYSYNLTPGDNDVVIMCPVVNGVINAFMMVYTDDNTTGDEGQIVADRIQFKWDELQ